MKRIPLIKFCAFLFVSLSLSLAAHAQFQATLQGTVFDPNGASVAEAKVTLTNQETGVSVDTTTTSDGLYKFTELAPGLYTVTVSAPNFKSNVTKDVSVRAEQPRGLDVKLELGAVSESVTVNGSVLPELQTQNADVAGTITNAEIQRLPIFNRDPYELVRLSPGVFGDGARSATGLTNGFPNGPGAGSRCCGPGGSNIAIFQVENQIPVSSNGQRVTSNYFQVDGVNVNSLEWGGAAVVTPSPDSVQEMTVVANDYDASDGRSSGAHVKVVTKGGTNTFHGSAFFQYEDPNMNAFNRYGGFTFNPNTFSPPVRNDDKFRQFGASLGGPIWKDKLFFFFNYEGLRDNNETFQNQFIETSQFRQALIAARPNTVVGATLAVPGIVPRVNQILTPSCNNWTTAGLSCQVVGNGIDIGSVTGAFGSYLGAFSLTDFYPNPNATTSGNAIKLDGIPDLQFAQIALPQVSTGNQYNPRIDFHWGRSVFTASAYLTYLNGFQADAAAQGRPMADINSNRFSPSAFLAWVFSFSPTLINEARFNFTRFGFDELSSNPQIDWAIPRTEIQSLPNTGQRIIFGAAEGPTSPGVFAENTFSYRDMVSKILSKHSLKFGVEFNQELDNDAQIGGGRPDLTFQGPWNFANGAPIFEQVDVVPTTGAPAPNRRYFRTLDGAGFVQDDWRLRPNFTLNLGLRYEYYGPPTEKNRQLSNIILGSGTTGYANAVSTNPSKLYPATWRNVGPRLGFAWSPDRFHSNAVLRGGFGIMYDRFDNVSFNNTRLDPPFFASYALCCGTAGSPFLNGQILYTLGTDPANPLAFPANPKLATAINPSTNLPALLPGQGAPDVWSVAANMPVPYTYEYSLQMEYALPHNWVATAGYQGSSSHHQLRIKNEIFFFPTGNAVINNDFQFTPDTNGNFNALVTQLQRRFNHGLAFTANYTYSKCIDNVSDEGPGFQTNQSFPTNLAFERGPCDYDSTHNFRAFALWDLPIFRDNHTFVGKILGGWEINGIFQFHSGFPWTPVTSNGCFLEGAATLCPVRPTTWRVGPQMEFNTESFLPPASGNFSSAILSQIKLPNVPAGTVPPPPGVGRNSYRGPRYSDFDFSVMKQFGLPGMRIIGEDAKIQLRANAYNAFNKLDLSPFQFGSQSTTVSFGNNGAGQPVYNPFFGLATSALQGRTIELEARFIF
ncbi:MAG TPA: carboxypeptidase regulatory-like domain-containing protein [Candidatus Acidoferrales bacterium]|nr:carboxypeptidase regulatory-like domain-containing protein [Candidatus Acidoferrales bacterium]